MSLTVLSVAYPFAPVGPDAVGGAEQVLAALDAALVAAGHRSIVVACAGSVTAGTLIETAVPRGVLTQHRRERTWAEHRGNVAHAMRTLPVDVVHMHGVDFHAYLPAPGAVPILATLHLPPAWYPAGIFEAGRTDLYLHCVSRPQHDACPPNTRLLPPIPNGVPVADLQARCRKRGFALALGRICPEKNLHVALEAARRANVPLLLGGQVFPYEEHQRYFRDEIAPRLDGERRFLGPIPFRRKRRLLAAARCVLLPTLAPETSSLVAMEALASGTPVIAFPSGAIPDIIEHGRTGFLVRDAEEMAAAIDASPTIAPEHCRAIARERFSLESMTARYFHVYQQLHRHAHRDELPIPRAAAVG